MAGNNPTRGCSNPLVSASHLPGARVQPGLRSAARRFHGPCGSAVVNQHGEQRSPRKLFTVDRAHGNRVQRADEFVYAALIFPDERGIAPVGVRP
jgi:hypothetical protein